MIRKFLRGFVQLFKGFFEKLIEFWRHIANASRITAVKLIFEKKLHFLERVFWIFIVILSISGANLLITNQIKRYYASPTVMSLDRDYRAWNGTLPAVTLCYHDHMDSYKADLFIREKWNMSIVDEDYFYFLEFLYAVINATAYNYLDLVRFADDERFEEIDLYEVAISIDRPFQQSLTTFDENEEIQIAPVMTERGMCYAVNAPMSQMLNVKDKTKKILKPPVMCQYGKQQCFIKMDIFESTGTIEVHSPYEVSASDAGVGAISLMKSDEVIASYKVMETSASEQLRELTPLQRKCVFWDEGTLDLKIYSKTLCLARCRAIMALEMCNCVPFFYPFVEGPTCNPAGFECLLDFKWPIWALHICKCPSTCNDHIYSIHSVKRSSWGGASDENYKVMSSFRWDIIPPKVRMRRDVVFSFEDLMVGGAIGLFLGSSFVSLIKVGTAMVEWFLGIFIDLIYKIKIACFSKMKAFKQNRKNKKLKKYAKLFILCLILILKFFNIHNYNSENISYENYNILDDLNPKTWPTLEITLISLQNSNGFITYSTRLTELSFMCLIA